VPVVKDSACMRAFAPAGLMFRPVLAQLSRRDLLNHLAQPMQADSRLLRMSYWRQRIAAVARELLPGQPLPARLVQGS
jgi:hypothetical protein